MWAGSETWQGVQLCSQNLRICCYAQGLFRKAVWRLAWLLILLTEPLTHQVLKRQGKKSSGGISFCSAVWFVASGCALSATPNFQIRMSQQAGIH